VERAPADIAAVVVPGNPGRRKDGSGQPVPAKGGIPAPTSIVIRRPAPGLARNPEPAPIAIAPAAVIIRAPASINARYPDIAVVLVVLPIAVIGEIIGIGVDAAVTIA